MIIQLNSFQKTNCDLDSSNIRQNESYVLLSNILILYIIMRDEYLPTVATNVIKNATRGSPRPSVTIMIRMFV